MNFKFEAQLDAIKNVTDPFEGSPDQMRLANRYCRYLELAEILK